MITQTFKMQFQCVMWITRHSSIWIANNSIHCSLPSQLRKLAKSGSWHCHLQWQCTRSCVTYLMQERYQWKEDELLFTYMPQANFDFRTMGLWIWSTFFLIRTVYDSIMIKYYSLRKSMNMRASVASELRKISHFHILKLLFPSIFCWYL